MPLNASHAFIALGSALAGVVGTWVVMGRTMRGQAQHESAGLREIVASRDSELMAGRGRVRDLETRLAALDSERHTANSHLVRLTSALETEQATVTSLRAALGEWQAKHDSTAAELASLRSERSTASGSTTSARSGDTPA